MGRAILIISQKWPKRAYSHFSHQRLLHFSCRIFISNCAKINPFIHDQHIAINEFYAYKSAGTHIYCISHCRMYT